MVVFVISSINGAKWILEQLKKIKNATISIVKWIAERIVKLYHKMRSSKKPKYILAIIPIIIIILVTIIVHVAGSNDYEELPFEPLPASTPTPQPEATPEPTPEPAPTPEPIIPTPTPERDEPPALEPTPSTEPFPSTFDMTDEEIELILNRPLSRDCAIPLPPLVENSDWKPTPYHIQGRGGGWIDFSHTDYFNPHAFHTIMQPLALAIPQRYMILTTDGKYILLPYIVRNNLYETHRIPEYIYNILFPNDVSSMWAPEPSFFLNGLDFRIIHNIPTYDPMR